jgi:hypothetical protein
MHLLLSLDLLLRMHLLLRVYMLLWVRMVLCMHLLHASGHPRLLWVYRNIRALVLHLLLDRLSMLLLLMELLKLRLLSVMMLSMLLLYSVVWMGEWVIRGSHR